MLDSSCNRADVIHRPTGSMQGCMHGGRWLCWRQQGRWAVIVPAYEAYVLRAMKLALLGAFQLSAAREQYPTTVACIVAQASLPAASRAKGAAYPPPPPPPSATSPHAGRQRSHHHNNPLPLPSATLSTPDVLACASWPTRRSCSPVYTPANGHAVRPSCATCGSTAPPCRRHHPLQSQSACGPCRQTCCR